MVEADTARNYFSLLAADVELRLLEDTLKSRDDSVALQKDRYQAGVIGEYDLRTAEAERASVAGDIAVARRAVSELESALAVLLGRSPREVFTPSVSRDADIARLTVVPDAALGRPVGRARAPARRPARGSAARRGQPAHRRRARRLLPGNLADWQLRHAGRRRSRTCSPGPAIDLGPRRVAAAAARSASRRSRPTSTRRPRVATRLLINYTQTVQGAFRDAHDALSANDTTREALAAQSERALKLQQALELSRRCATGRAIRRISRCSTRSASCCRRRRCRSSRRATCACRSSTSRRPSAAAGITRPRSRCHRDIAPDSSRVSLV